MLAKTRSSNRNIVQRREDTDFTPDKLIIYTELSAERCATEINKHSCELKYSFLKINLIYKL